MRVLVIGREGQVAHGLRTASARRQEIELTAVGRPEVELDIPDTLAAALTRHAPEIVINTAAYTDVDGAETDAGTAFRHNAEAAQALAGACAAAGIPLIHLSTDYVFDGTAGRPYREDDVTAPLGAYGRSKLAGEWAVAATLDRHLIVRTAWIYSAIGRNFAKTMLKLGVERDVVRVVADQRGTPTYAPHLAEFLLFAARRALSPMPPPWGIYHAVGSGETTWHGFAQRVFAAAKCYGRAPPEVEAIQTVDYPTPASRPQDSRLDASRARFTFGWSLPPWEDGVTAAVTAMLSPRHARPLDERTGA